MKLHINPGQPSVDERDDSLIDDEEAISTLNRHEITNWVPIGFDEEFKKLTVLVNYEKPELISRYSNRDTLEVALLPNLTEILKSESG